MKKYISGALVSGLMLMLLTGVTNVSARIVNPGVATVEKYLLGYQHSYVRTRVYDIDYNIQHRAGFGTDLGKKYMSKWSSTGVEFEKYHSGIGIKLYGPEYR